MLFDNRVTLFFFFKLIRNLQEMILPTVQLNLFHGD